MNEKLLIDRSVSFAIKDLLLENRMNLKIQDTPYNLVVNEIREFNRLNDILNLGWLTLEDKKSIRSANYVLIDSIKRSLILLKNSVKDRDFQIFYSYNFKAEKFEYLSEIYELDFNTIKRIVNRMTVKFSVFMHPDQVALSITDGVMI